MQCPKGSHLCLETWDCGHGRRFPKHNVDGQDHSSTDGRRPCLECRAECAEASEQVSAVGRRLYRRLVT